MQFFYEDYLNNLKELHENIVKTIGDLGPAALDWKPAGPDSNSISALIFHLTGAERYWLGDVVAQEPSYRDRQAEFLGRGLGLQALTDRLTDSLGYAQITLAKLTLPDLETIRISPRDGRTFTVAWALAHALKHTALHTGHIELTHQLWGQQE